VEEEEDRSHHQQHHWNSLNIRRLSNRRYHPQHPRNAKETYRSWLRLGLMHIPQKRHGNLRISKRIKLSWKEITQLVFLVEITHLVVLNLHLVVLVEITRVCVGCNVAVLNSSRKLPMRVRTSVTSSPFMTLTVMD